jgi:hypothetical protein
MSSCLVCGEEKEGDFAASLLPANKRLDKP